MQIGDIVWMSRKWCRNIMASAPVANRQGEIVWIGEPLSQHQPNHKLVKVLWDGDDEPSGVLSVNLTVKKLKTA